MQCITLPHLVYFLNVFELAFIESLFPSTSEREQLITQPYFIAENHESFILHPQTNRTLSLRDNNFYFEAQVV